jgi:hypothetical protein
MGAMSTLLVAALGATQTNTNPSTSSTPKPADSTSNNFTPAVKPTSTSSHSGPDNVSDSTATVESYPSSPRTTTTDTASTSSRRHASMGGRTKAVTFAETAAAAAGSTGFDAVGAAGVLRYGAAAAAAAASAAGRGGGVSALGSLAVDPDEVVRKIKGHATQLPLDEALMEVRGGIGGIGTHMP